MEVHFSNIKENIIRELNKAKFSIYICVAWVSENFIIEELCNCLKLGIQVELLLNNDNKFDYSKHKFKDFVTSGGRLFLFDTAEKLMHNKFCVIDLSTTVMGSFNWTYGATKHEENIVIQRNDIETSHLFASQFVKLKRQSTLYSNFYTGNADLYHHVKVNFSTIEDSNPRFALLILDFYEGSRKASKQVSRDEFEKALGHKNYPKEILGFWKMHTVSYFDEISTEQIIEYYDFVCVDSRFHGILLTDLERNSGHV